MLRGGKFSGCLGNIHVLQGVGDKNYKDSATYHNGEVFRGPVIWACWVILSKIKVKFLHSVTYTVKNRPFWV